MLSAIIACGIQVLQVKLRARLFFKTTYVASYTCVTSWQYSCYNTIARLIPLKLVFKFSIVSCTCIVASYIFYQKLYSFCNTIARLTTEVIFVIVYILHSSLLLYLVHV